MEYSNIRIMGKFTAELKTELSTYNSDEEGSLSYIRADNQLYYGNEVDSDFRSLVDIPKWARIFFESDTTILGYSLLTSVDDALLYITKGSAALGEPGASLKDSGSWTATAHTHTQLHEHTGGTHSHTLNNHTHTISAHNHQFIKYSGVNNTRTYNSSGVEVRLQDYDEYHGSGLVINVTDNGADPRSVTGDRYTKDNTAQTTTAPGFSVSSDSPYTLDEISNENTGNMEYQPDAPTWRPRGRNFTRQSRL
jgi:hypothetical protein